AQRLDDALARRRVAQADGEVAQPALVADAVDRAAGQAAMKVLLAPAEQLCQFCLVQAIADTEVRLVRKLRVFVPGTRELAVVAAVDAVADQRAKLDRDRALQLDGEVRNA